MGLDDAQGTEGRRCTLTLLDYRSEAIGTRRLCAGNVFSFDPGIAGHGEPWDPGISGTLGIWGLGTMGHLDTRDLGTWGFLELWGFWGQWDTEHIPADATF